MIKQLLKKLVSYLVKNKEYIQKENILFNEITDGDLIFANMPLSKKELSKVPKGHRERPYYVAYTYDSYLVAYPLTSKLRNINDMLIYKINNYSYPEIKKDSYLILKDEVKLPRENIKFCICKVKENDFNQIQRRLYFNNKKRYISLYKQKPKYCVAQKGDIVRYRDKNYLVFNEEKNKFKLLQINAFVKSANNKIITHLNTKPFIVHPDKEIIVKKKDYPVVHILTGYEYQKVLNEYERYLKKQKSKNKHVRKQRRKQKMKKKEIPNEETIEALKEYKAMKENKNGEYKTYKTFAEAVKDILAEDTPNEETANVIEDVKQGKNMSKEYTSLDELFKDLKK